MSQRIVIDCLSFAREARVLQGELPVAGFERIQDGLTQNVGVIRYRIEGRLGKRNRPQLHLQLDGVLSLCCQRCLGGLKWPLRVDTLLQPVRSGQEIPEEELENDEVDAIEIEGELDVLALLEDEILLALPIAPRHQVCEAPRPQGGTSKESPFAALASLRGSPIAE